MFSSGSWINFFTITLNVDYEENLGRFARRNMHNRRDAKPAGKGEWHKI
jgi:hypothetical protein